MRLTAEQSMIGHDPRGRYGMTCGLGLIHNGYSRFGDLNPYAGIYKRSRFAVGKRPSIMPFYWPSNPQTVPQQSWRSVFTAGVAAYHALTAPELAPYTERAKRLHRTAFNVYMSDYLASHRI